MCIVLTQIVSEFFFQKEPHHGNSKYHGYLDLVGGIYNQEKETLYRCVHTFSNKGTEFEVCHNLN